MFWANSHISKPKLHNVIVRTIYHSHKSMCCKFRHVPVSVVRVFDVLSSILFSIILCLFSVCYTEALCGCCVWSAVRSMYRPPVCWRYRLCYISFCCLVVFLCVLRCARRCVSSIWRTHRGLALGTLALTTRSVQYPQYTHPKHSHHHYLGEVLGYHSSRSLRRITLTTRTRAHPHDSRTARVWSVGRGPAAAPYTMYGTLCVAAAFCAIL